MLKTTGLDTGLQCKALLEDEAWLLLKVLFPVQLQEEEAGPQSAWAQFHFPPGVCCLVFHQLSPFLSFLAPGSLEGYYIWGQKYRLLFKSRKVLLT